MKESRRVFGTARDVGNAVQRELQQPVEKVVVPEQQLQDGFPFHALAWFFVVFICPRVVCTCLLDFSYMHTCPPHWLLDCLNDSACDYKRGACMLYSIDIMK